MLVANTKSQAARRKQFRSLSRGGKQAGGQQAGGQQSREKQSRVKPAGCQQARGKQSGGKQARGKTNATKGMTGGRGVRGMLRRPTTGRGTARRRLLAQLSPYRIVPPLLSRSLFLSPCVSLSFALFLCISTMIPISLSFFIYAQPFSVQTASVRRHTCQTPYTHKRAHGFGLQQQQGLTCNHGGDATTRFFKKPT